MNKLPIILGYFGLGFVCLVIVTIIMIFRPDATATIIQFVGTIMGIASTGAVTFYMLGEQGKKIETVEKQTNGINSALREENAELTRKLLQVVGSSPSAPPAHENPDRHEP